MFGLWLSAIIQVRDTGPSGLLSLIVISSPEHEMLMVSCCDQSISIVRRQHFALNDNSSYILRPVSIKLHRNVA